MAAVRYLCGIFVIGGLYFCTIAVVVTSANIKLSETQYKALINRPAVEHTSTDLWQSEEGSLDSEHRNTQDRSTTTAHTQIYTNVTNSFNHLAPWYGTHDMKLEYQRC